MSNQKLYSIRILLLRDIYLFIFDGSIHLARPNVEWSIFRNFKISNIKIERWVTWFFIFEFIF